MATSYKTPGVYVEEISKLPPSVAQVETAIPAFIGYTETNVYNGLSLLNKPTRIKSLKEYEDIFGFPKSAVLTINLNPDNTLNGDVAVSALEYRMYYALQLYFANGGGPCYITSSGTYLTATGKTQPQKHDEMFVSLVAVGKEDEPTMLLFPDAPLLAEPLAGGDGDAQVKNKTQQYHQIFKDALQQSANLMDRVTVIDVFETDGITLALDKQTGVFRDSIGNNFLSYGAAYYPWLRTTLLPFVNEELPAALVIAGGAGLPANPVLRKEVNGVGDPSSLFHFNNKLYFDIKKSLGKNSIIMPPSSAIAGVYAMVDSTRGVWKAPANVSLSMVAEPMVKIDDEDQRDMNVSDTGKSINAIRTFSGKGILVWGARTLAGNDNEWRYISVRRFFNMVEESVKKASEPFVFEPNDANTWAKVKGMIENFLTLQWRAGALMGDKPDEAFFVHVGLGETMTALDIFEGRMIVEIGMAAVRPAEFIILRFSHKMLETS
jgi:phage tail sheath protein FI